MHWIGVVIYRTPERVQMIILDSKNKPRYHNKNIRYLLQIMTPKNYTDIIKLLAAPEKPKAIPSTISLEKLIEFIDAGVSVQEIALSYHLSYETRTILQAIERSKKNPRTSSAIEVPQSPEERLNSLLQLIASGFTKDELIPIFGTFTKEEQALFEKPKPVISGKERERAELIKSLFKKNKTIAEINKTLRSRNLESIS